jgi:hypothetical protein
MVYRFFFHIRVPSFLHPRQVEALDDGHTGRAILGEIFFLLLRLVVEAKFLSTYFLVRPSFN